MKKIDKMSDGELRSELRQTRMLLAVAKCPDTGCYRRGFTVVPDGDGQAMQQQCQWCDKRSALIGQS